MKEITGDIWDFHKQGHWIVITTNGTVKANGEAVMGRGVALQAKQKFPDVPKLLGDEIRRRGNCLTYESSRGLIFFPVKHNYWKRADLDLIEKSVKELVDLFDNVIDYPTPIYMVRPGCGYGQLDWKDVKPILERYLDDRFVVVNL